MPTNTTLSRKSNLQRPSSNSATIIIYVLLTHAANEIRLWRYHGGGYICAINLRPIGDEARRYGLLRHLGLNSNTLLKYGFIVPGLSDTLKESGALDDAVKNVNAIIHTTSPVHLSADEPSEQIDLAVGGVDGILKSAMKNGSDSLKRVVISSSCAVILSFSTTPVAVSEADWNELSIKECEEKGRKAANLTLAENAACAFYEKHKSEIKWDISIINPAWVFGPSWRPVIHEVMTVGSLNPSSRLWCNAVVKEDFEGFSSLTTPGHGWTDVRDVATAHVCTMEEVPSAGGERIIRAIIGRWKKRPEISWQIMSVGAGRFK
ncbi:NAD(P)-binding protein [Desarmillaria ectypa]|nr:NAD(P)-binding protein [Desarmillaria ectypa]